MDLYYCDYCNKEFENSKVLANHVRWKHVYTESRGYSKKGKKVHQEKCLKREEEKYGKWINAITTCSCHKCSVKLIIQYREVTDDNKNFYCSYSCAQSRYWDEEHKNKLSNSVKETLNNNPDIYNSFIDNLNSANRRNSSKIERRLAEKLKSRGFHRHGKARINNQIIDIDIKSDDNNIWIESDGPFHFKKVHKNHNFMKTKERDKLQNREAIKTNKLLLRIKNWKYDLNEQLNFVLYSINNWDGNGRVLKLY